jgi:2-polyprenyl-3-methyl-5-hydroxy-6-metoxy-1,4-benzoquinol methylase
MGPDSDTPTYDRRYYETRYAEQFDHQDRTLDVYRSMVDFSHAVAGERALVVGCGLGGFAQALAERNAEVTAIDLSATAIAIAQSRYSGPTFQEMDCRDLRHHFEPGSFDLVALVQVIEHIQPEDVADVIAQVADVLDVRGRCLVDVPITDNISDSWLILRNRLLFSQVMPSSAIDSSFDPTHKWKIGALEPFIRRFERVDLFPSQIAVLYYAPHVLCRLQLAPMLNNLPETFRFQLLKGATILFDKGKQNPVTCVAHFSTLWGQRPRMTGLARLKRLLA